MSSLQQIIRHTVQLHGNRVATRFAGRTRTWSELQNRIARLASGLHALGIEEGDRVAVLALNSDRYYEFYFGAAWAGAVFVPVNTRLAPAEFLHWLNDSGSKALFVDDSFLEAVSGKSGTSWKRSASSSTWGRRSAAGLHRFRRPGGWPRAGQPLRSVW